MFCERCGEDFNLNILTGECYSCGVDKDNDPLISSRIRDVKLSPDLIVRGKIINGEMSVYVLNKKGVVVARGWDNVSTI